MLAKLFGFLKYEKQLLAELVELAEKQQKALVHFDMSALNDVSSSQEHLALNLRKVEEQRIDFIMNWLRISRNDAHQMQLSSIESKLQGESHSELKSMRENLKGLIDKLNNLNTTNRILANRAKHSVSQSLSSLTNGSNHVYNVKV